MIYHFLPAYFEILFFYVDQYLSALRLCQNWVDTVGLSSPGCWRPAISSQITNYFHLQLMMQLWNITVNVGCNLAHILVKFTNSLFFLWDRQTGGREHISALRPEVGRFISFWERRCHLHLHLLLLLLLLLLLYSVRIAGCWVSFVPTCESNSMWKDTISAIKSWFILDISAYCSWK